MGDLISKSALIEDIERSDLSRVLKEKLEDLIEEQPSVEEKPTRKGRKINLRYRKRFLSMARESCYHYQVVEGNANNGTCGGVMGGDRYTDGLNYYCVSCPYLNLAGVEKIFGKSVEEVVK